MQKGEGQPPIYATLNEVLYRARGAGTSGVTDLGRGARACGRKLLGATVRLDAVAGSGTHAGGRVSHGERERQTVVLGRLRARRPGPGRSCLVWTYQRRAEMGRAGLGGHIVLSAPGFLGALGFEQREPVLVTALKARVGKAVVGSVERSGSEARGEGGGRGVGRGRLGCQGG